LGLSQRPIKKDSMNSQAILKSLRIFYFCTRRERYSTEVAEPLGVEKQKIMQNLENNALSSLIKLSRNRLVGGGGGGDGIDYRRPAA
jgi:hypothetical protein